MARRALLVATILFLGPGCSFLARSSLPLVYDTYFDNIIEDRLTGFMDLSSEQSDFVDAQADRYVAWHRREMLPRFAHALERDAGIIRRGNVSAQEVEASVQSFRALWMASVAPLSQWVAKVMVAQDREQLRYMEEEWQERHQEATEMARKPEEERIKEATEKISEAFDDFLVSVADTQRQVIRSWVEEMSSRPLDWMDERVRRWKILMSKLRNGAPEAEVQRYLALLYADPARLGPPEYQEQVEASRTMFKRFLQRFFNSLSAGQRDELYENVTELAADLRELSDD